MIPIYRAKHHIDDIYFIGSLIGKDDEYYIVQEEDMEYYRPIDITTLAIHFPNMLDSQGNKIFASLSKDGKGGDMTNKGICLYEPKYNQFRIIVNLKTRTWLEITREDLESYPVKVIGIQE